MTYHVDASHIECDVSVSDVLTLRLTIVWIILGIYVGAVWGVYGLTFIGFSTIVSMYCICIYMHVKNYIVSKQMSMIDICFVFDEDNKTLCHKEQS